MIIKIHGHIHSSKYISDFIFDIHSLFFYLYFDFYLLCILNLNLSPTFTFTLL